MGRVRVDEGVPLMRRMRVEEGAEPPDAPLMTDTSFPLGGMRREIGLDSPRSLVTTGLSGRNSELFCGFGLICQCVVCSGRKGLTALARASSIARSIA
jgi:hypothetical protein